MKCYCCNKTLSDYESTIKSVQSGEFLDTCLKCLEDLNITWKGRPDLSPFSEPDDDEYDYSEIDD